MCVGVGGGIIGVGLQRAQYLSTMGSTFYIMNLKNISWKLSKTPSNEISDLYYYYCCCCCCCCCCYYYYYYYYYYCYYYY